MPRDHDRQPLMRSPRSPRHRPVRSILAVGTAAAAGAALLLLTAFSGIVGASTPATLGYRDFGYGGAQATRATSDPEQSKLWYNDGAWWGGLFVSSGTGSGGSHFNIFKFNPVTHSWSDTTVRIDSRDHSHADYLWDGTHLYVVSSKGICDTVFDGLQPCNDSIRVYRFSYNALTTTKYSLDTGFPKTLAGGGFTGPNFTGGGSNAVTIARDTAGEVWVAYTRDDPTTAGPPITGFHSNVYLAHSVDGVNWSVPALFASASAGQLGEGNTAAVVAFGNKIGVYWTDKQLSGASSAFFAVHADGDPVGTWSTDPTIVSTTNAVANQVNLKADSAGKVYAVIKTDLTDQIRLYDRSTGGTWTQHNVSTSGNGNTRAQVVIDDDNHVAYVFSSSGSTTAGTIYVKSAPLGTLSFPTGKGAAFISSSTDHTIDDITLTKQTVGSATGIVGEASDRGTLWFLHGELALPSADTTAPSGTVAVNAGAAATAAVDVTLNLTATDVGIGVNQVRAANSAGVDGNGVLNGAGAASFSWTSTVPWSFPAGDGTKTVHVQFQDGAGNWSTPISDDIIFDTTGPVGAVSINGGASPTNDTAVTLDVTASDAGVGVVSNVRIANAGTLSGGLLSDASAVTSAYAPTKPWNLAPGPDGPRTVWAQWQDSLGNWSAPSSDGIDVADTVAPVGNVVINGGAAGVRTLSVNLTFPSTSADVTEVDVSNSPTMAGAVTKPFAASVPWTLSGPLTNGVLKSVYVIFRDGAGNTSPIVATDSAKVDLTRPVMHSPVTASLVSGSALSGNSILLRVSWPAATDTVTGVAGYRVLLSRDGHAFVAIGAPTVRSMTVLAAAFHTYRFRVYAVDRAGNASFSVYSPTVRVVAYQDSNRAIHYSRGWHATSSTLFYGGTARYTQARGASASLTFTGRSVAWMAVLAANRGYARVYLDGRLISTVNLRAATTSVRRIVFARTWSTSRTHVIRIVGLGTAGHPRVDVDAFIVLR